MYLSRVCDSKKKAAQLREKVWKVSSERLGGGQ